MFFRMATITTALLLCTTLLRAAEPGSTPKPAPLTRPEMKQALENLKKAQPRIPLPPLTEKEIAERGGRPPVNNGRMRQLYLGTEMSGGDFVRGADPAMTLDNAFKTMLFWIVSRSNNCHY